MKYMLNGRECEGRYAARLACVSCDRDDWDFIGTIYSATTTTAGWADIIEERTIEETQTGDGYEWWTHIGVCPDCRAEYFRNEHGPNPNGGEPTVTMLKREKAKPNSDQRELFS